MKGIIIFLIATAGFNAQAACIIDGVLKKATAKTVYVNGTSMSLKKLDAAGCIVKTTVLSAADVKKLNVAILVAKLAKARAKK